MIVATLVLACWRWARRTQWKYGSFKAQLLAWATFTFSPRGRYFAMFGSDVVRVFGVLGPLSTRYDVRKPTCHDSVTSLRLWDNRSQRQNRTKQNKNEKQTNKNTHGRFTNWYLLVIRPVPDCQYPLLRLTLETLHCQILTLKVDFLCKAEWAKETSKYEQLVVTFLYIHLHIFTPSFVFTVTKAVTLTVFMLNSSIWNSRGYIWLDTYLFNPQNAVGDNR